MAEIQSSIGHREEMPDLTLVGSLLLKQVVMEVATVVRCPKR
jgi:hypothetical protein